MCTPYVNLSPFLTPVKSGITAFGNLVKGILKAAANSFVVKNMGINKVPMFPLLKGTSKTTLFATFRLFPGWSEKRVSLSIDWSFLQNILSGASQRRLGEVDDEEEKAFDDAALRKVREGSFGVPGPMGGFANETHALPMPNGTMSRRLQEEAPRRLSALSSFTNTLKTTITNAVNSIFSSPTALIKKLIEFACNNKDKLCLTIKRGAWVNFKIDFPSVVNTYIKDIHITFPTSDWKTCLYSFVPSTFRPSCLKRRLQEGNATDSSEDEAPEPPPPAELCYDFDHAGVENEINLSIDPRWIELPESSNATRRCFLAPYGQELLNETLSGNMRRLYSLEDSVSPIGV
jgi:hypothetical protein